MTKHVEDEHGGPKMKVPKTFCRHCYKSFPHQQFKGIVLIFSKERNFLN